MKMLKIILFGAILGALVSVALAQSNSAIPFDRRGPTVTVTAATSAPTPVQSSSSSLQYVITNIGSVTAFVAYAASSAAATAGCAVPPSDAIPVLPLSQVTVTSGANAWFCGITSSSTAVLYITPGQGY